MYGGVVMYRNETVMSNVVASVVDPAQTYVASTVMHRSKNLLYRCLYVAAAHSIFFFIPTVSQLLCGFKNCCEQPVLHPRT